MSSGILTSVGPVAFADNCAGLRSPTSGPCLPVKNTFIHFEGLSQQSRGRTLRRCCTDPAEPVSLTLRSLSSDTDSTASVGLCSDTCSTTGPASENDLLEATVDFEANLDTPESTPRHARDPWVSPIVNTSLPSVPPMPTITASCPPFPSVAHAPPSPTSDSSEVSSLLSSSPSFTPASCTLLEAALNSLSAERSPAFLEGGFCFGFTLRLADEVGLGVDLTPVGSSSLLVQRVFQKGAIDAWNKQCFDGTAKRFKAIWPGDTIVSVNGKREPADMINECKSKMLLKLTVFRAVCDDGPCLGLMPTDCYWPSMQAYNVMFQSYDCEGERLHSCKKHITL